MEASEGYVNCQNMAVKRLKGFHLTATKQCLYICNFCKHSEEKQSFGLVDLTLTELNVSCGLTWSVGLQVPGPPGASGQDGGGQGGVNGTTGLHIPSLVPRRGDLQDRDGGALVQLPSGRQHLCESLIAHADASLQRAAQSHVWFEPQVPNIKGVLGPRQRGGELMEETLDVGMVVFAWL